MNRAICRLVVGIIIFLSTGPAFGDDVKYLDALAGCNIAWDCQSSNSSESMPVGGGDVGLNVWVEDNKLLFYMARSGTFDENNQMLKLGRVRIQLSPNPFSSKTEFRQELKLQEGHIEVTGNNPGVASAKIRLWVEVFRPVIHVDIGSDRPVSVEAAYESWRLNKYERPAGRGYSFSLAGCPGKVFMYQDTVLFADKGVLWYHRNNNDDLVFDKEVHGQGLDTVKDRLWNPLKDLTFGGLFYGEAMVPSGNVSGRYLDTDYKGWKLAGQLAGTSHRIKIFLHTAQAPTLDKWKQQLAALAGAPEPTDEQAWEKNLRWWNDFWQRSHLIVDSSDPQEKDVARQVGRNYQLFRYLLACNAYGQYPTKFNGGLFTFDVSPLSNGRQREDPDFRKWGGGSFTAQNQRLVYWPMLKTGDFDMMRPQFEFYRRALPAAILRTRVYWGHEGACFTEQIEQFGLPIGAAYGWEGSPTSRNRPEGLEAGVQSSGAVKYHYVNQLEFSLMVLDYCRYSGRDISAYMPFIENSVLFFDEHYRYRCRQLTGQELGKDGKLVIYPSACCETYGDAENPTDVIAGLTVVLRRLLELPEHYATEQKKRRWRVMLERLPAIKITDTACHRTIAPAHSWRMPSKNSELPQLYTVFPYKLYGVGKPDLQLAVDTWRYGVESPFKRSAFCWFQGNIFTAMMGLTEDAKRYAVERFTRRCLRFPAFWNCWSFDHPPDFDHGGGSMIGLQEMLMQTDGRKIYLFPAWPKDWDVDFKLHAPYQTVVEGVLRDGKIEVLKVTPQERGQDLIVMGPQ
ncbi:MAG TPA: DUF5703 domain-containing protein [Sedimentisphaerales bacterium]|nr:DUF5703 domain-containing protein [Sedimentisphaerales bacterium]